MGNTILTLQNDFQIFDSITESATTSSAAHALPLDSNDSSLNQTLMITNEDSTNLVRFALGGSGVAADTDSVAILAGRTIIVSRNNASHIALKTDSGTVSTNIVVGSYAG